MTPLRLVLPVLLSLVALLGPAPSAAASPGTVAADLRIRINAALGRSTAASFSLAVDVHGLGSFYRRNATTSLPPASTQKLFTTFAALEATSATARFRTEVRASIAQAGSYQPGTVALVGGGDPYLSSTQLDGLAQQIRNAGITRIGGPLVVDDYRYDAVRRAPGWKSSYVPDESGPLSALAVDRNGWRRDSAYLADPGLPTLARFRDLLAKRGVTVGGGSYRARAATGARVVAVQTSSTMAEIVRKVDKDSDNFAAELLLKEVGLVVRGSGTTAAGVAGVRSVLGAREVTIGTTADGSGLSTSDRQTAAGELSLLVAAERSGVYGPLRKALPVACVDGTLKERMCGTAAAGRATGKTGTLPGVYALTGWTTTADGHLARFAVLLSGATSGSMARAAIDDIVVLLSAARVDG